MRAPEPTPDPPPYDLLLATVDALSEAIFVKDREGRYLMVNPAAATLYGRPCGEIVGRTDVELFGLDMAQAALDCDRKVVTSGQALRDVVTVGDGEGERVYVVNRVPYRTAEGRIVGVIGTIRDSTERAREHRALRASEQAYRTLVETSPNGIAVTDLEGRLTFGNSRLADLFGYASPDELLSVDTLDLIAPEDRERARAALSRPMEERGARGVEYTLLRRDGSRFFGQVSATIMRDAQGRPAGITNVVWDVSDRKLPEQELERLALYDSLTGLPNRVLFHDRLTQALLSAKRENTQVALLILDLDRFKEVNDTFGHQYGDLLLQQVGPRLAKAVRASDTIARLGGDEFAVLLRGAGAGSAVRIAQKIGATLSAPFDVSGQTLDLAASIGIALAPQHGSDGSELLRAADVAMYVAKRDHAGHAVYSSDEDRNTPARITLASELRQAIATARSANVAGRQARPDDGLHLHFQPVIELKTGRCDHVEVLARWHHPERGFIPPSEFIPVAEQVGLIKDLTLWVLTGALRQARRWFEQGLQAKVAVNLSARGLHDPRFARAVARIVRGAATSPTWLGLEITESAVMADPERSMETLARLHAMGLTIAIDDFGTGYSSLAYLQRLPVDEIKIDRSFTSQIVSSRDDSFIVRSIADLGHNRGLRVVAEGVEDEASLRILSSLGCDLAQGYHLGRPMPAGAMTDWLRSQRD